MATRTRRRFTSKLRRLLEQDDPGYRDHLCSAIMAIAGDDSIDLDAKHKKIASLLDEMEEDDDMEDDDEEEDEDTEEGDDVGADDRDDQSPRSKRPLQGTQGKSGFNTGEGRRHRRGRGRTLVEGAIPRGGKALANWLMH
jgi:hypothetical protein